jgi:hypothetical protein
MSSLSSREVDDDVIDDVIEMDVGVGVEGNAGMWGVQG